MSYPVIREHFRITCHVMAARNLQSNDPSYDWKYSTHGMLFLSGLSEQYGTSMQFIGIEEVGPFRAFEGEYPGIPSGVTDVIIGNVARATVGFPSGSVQTLEDRWYDEYGDIVDYDAGYGDAPSVLVSSEPASNLDLSGSDEYSVGFTTDNYILAYANALAGLSYSWIATQSGPMPAGSTTKSVSISYEANAGQVNFSATENFPLLDYQYYSTSDVGADQYNYVYANVPPTPIPNANSGAKPGTTYLNSKVTSGQFNHTAAQFFHYA
jgi:hypothetical protein